MDRAAWITGDLVPGKQFLVIRIMKKTIGRFVSDGLKMEESLS
jgi:hypothetical protein